VDWDLVGAMLVTYSNSSGRAGYRSGSLEVHGKSRNSLLIRDDNLEEEGQCYAPESLRPCRYPDPGVKKNVYKQRWSAELEDSCQAIRTHFIYEPLLIPCVIILSYCLCSVLLIKVL